MAALSTTKRKFHRVLDSISSSNASAPAPPPPPHPPLPPPASPAPAPSAPVGLERPVKKAKTFVRPQSAYVSSSPRLSMLLANRSRESLADPHAEKQTPQYVPWSREQFLERLETYSRSVLNFSTKPDEINEVAWAKRGWRCVAPETVGCGACGKRIVIDIWGPAAEGEDEERSPTREGRLGSLAEYEEHTEWKKAARKQLVERYEKMVVEGHHADCLWRRKGCDATIQRLPLGASTASALDALRIRYGSLLDKAEELPTTVMPPEGLDLEAAYRHFSLLYPTSPTADPRNTTIDAPSPAPAPTALPPVEARVPPSVDHATRVNALGFALLGWSRAPPQTPPFDGGLVTCGACFRRLGLWLWKPRRRSNGVVLEPCKLKMDIETEHRDYCPWTNAAAQGAGRDAAEEGECGWAALARALGNEARRKSLQTRDGKGAPGRGAGGDGGSGEAAREDRESVEAKDKERWAKLKKLKEAFRVKRVKRPGNESDGSRPATAG